jgi:hypothetical protein
MTEKEFFKKISNGQTDIVKQFLDLLKKLKADYCIIGGLAVNAYSEPVVSLDIDAVIVLDEIELLLDSVKKTFKIKKFPHSINLSSSKSDLRIQIQIDPRYQDFLKNAKTIKIMGYPMRVADVEDVLQGKIWAYMDQTRRLSKRQKDLADIFRLVEKFSELKRRLPDSLKKMI